MENCLLLSMMLYAIIYVVVADDTMIWFYMKVF